MGDTLDETPPTRQHKPQTLQINQSENNADGAAAAARCERTRTRNERERERERDHSCDGSLGKRNDAEFVGLVAPPRRESLNSVEAQQSQQQQQSPSSFSSSLNKALSGASGGRGTSATRYPSSVVVGGGIGSLAGTTTRKCVLTLDGYSYVIVASTPETLPGKRDEAGGSSSGGSNSTASGAAVGGAVASGNSVSGGGGGSSSVGVAVECSAGADNGEPSPISLELGNGNATLNGQVAKHGSLTIVRRSNSRKNFTQIDGQTQSLASPSAAASSSSSSAGINFFQTPLSESLAERLSGRTNGNTSSSTSNSSNVDRPLRAADSQNRIECTITADKMQPSSPNQTNFTTDTQLQTSADPSTYDFRPDRESSESAVSPRAQPTLKAEGSSIQSFDTVSNISVVGQWETETLPPVDTPDALNKAAMRIRSLLRRMDHEAVAFEDMQRNLHYAARVLEAVFIDESSSDNAKQRCNGNCKSINNNNNANSNCSMHQSEQQPEQAAAARPRAEPEETTTTTTTTTTDNQSSESKESIESRTKGVSLAPQTHSGPTGPPQAAAALATVSEEQQDTPTTEAAAATTTVSSVTNVAPSVSSSSSCSNKATVQRQRRLRTPVWARSMSTNKTRMADEDDELSEVQPDAVPPEVREWLASTFTRQMATTRSRTDEKPKFRSVAHAIRAGIFVDRIYRRVSSTALMEFPPDVVKMLKNLDNWTFDVFALTEAASGQVIKYVAYDLLNRYGAMHKFKIAPGVLETFLHRVEEGYCRYRNPYHNNLHATDVMVTMHYFLYTGLMNWLTDLEIFAALLAALIHDFEHTGTTNNFHVMSGSDTALLYNDRAVLENHHVSATFRLMKDDDANILSHLSREEYREMRTLMIDMVLATDMTCHFQQLKTMRNLLTMQDATIEKSKALSLVLHCSDIAHPSKHWDVHHRWTMLLLEEFFRQGDLEKELGLPFSPLCDRKSTLVAESQIGFIDFIVDPSMSVMSDMLEHILAPIAPVMKAKPAPLLEENAAETETPQQREQANPDDKSGSVCPMVRKSHSSQLAAPNKFSINKPWASCLTENKKIWKEQAIREAFERRRKSNLS
ncbi:calcium/calmodulin-dependent 3',5'-cyclic nucleotide phosphodiesterase 1 isoform X2 [Drosophila busckii]|uniref:calcium/calmodulin-dependent 3',5'-cyclic nucleotide phosphodiesterase 1 isoform X2 n=1 Tax=Drosophila busckii TaxID=30019 RepID=UPI00143347E5|nr:calcium/calmodulin-dependent 3',5'-cyclic nucleotide phosphodiesterase 1 isoform X2 [Drosophila busckii]